MNAFLNLNLSQVSFLSNNCHNAMSAVLFVVKIHPAPHPPPLTFLNRELRMGIYSVVQLWSCSLGWGKLEIAIAEDARGACFYWTYACSHHATWNVSPTPQALGSMEWNLSVYICTCAWSMERKHELNVMVDRLLSTRLSLQSPLNWALISS